MTQLFDTDTYDDETDTESAPSGRHLRSIPTAAVDLTERSTQWQLDNDTIESGRRGIALARQALREAAKARSSHDQSDAGDSGDSTDRTSRKAA